MLSKTPKKWTPAEDAKLRAARASGKQWTEVGALLGCGPEMCRHRHKRLSINGQEAVENRTEAKMPEPSPVAGGPSIPEPLTQRYDPFTIDATGTVGIIADIHIPLHDKRTIEEWVADCKKRDAKVLFLNGDVLDFGMLSHFPKEPGTPSVRDELEKGRQLLAYLRAEFPRARIVYKLGNHDERLAKFLTRSAKELEDLESLQLPELLEMSDHGIECVADKRVVMVGKLPVVHGHEFQGSGGVMPARWLYLRTGDTAMAGHFHQPSFYPFRTILDSQIGCWSLGCACFLSPKYRPLNQWRHGFAQVEVATNGTFRVHNFGRLKDGSIVPC